jgi:hypothetical protein
MKKIFTLIVMAVMALGANAETLINYPTAQDGITASGYHLEISDHLQICVYLEIFHFIL